MPRHPHPVDRTRLERHVTRRATAALLDAPVGRGEMALAALMGAACILAMSLSVVAMALATAASL